MDIINIDKFVDKFQVKINGENYICEPMKVKDVLNGIDLEDNIKFILDHSNIPENVLNGLSIGKISGIVKCITGEIRNMEDLLKFSYVMNGTVEEPPVKKN